ncbi:MAG: 2,3-dehydroadipyl-CoA hydratase [Hyphococcus sp.]|nr:MAG: 2,3-dehydroadipyl-CoA hydratase [Marinicaulis sp.]
MSNASSTLLLEEAPSSGVKLLQLNRPEKRNALATPLLSALADALEAGDVDDTIRAMVITGGEKIFAAGADINEMAPKQAPEGLSDVRPSMWKRIRATRKPVVAAVEGWCLGAGNELLLCCDIAVASKEAKFGQPETNLGIIPGAGGGATLARLVGRARAMQMVLTGKPITAEEAVSYGLVAELTDPGKATERAVELATDIASRAPLAMQQAKAVVNAAFDMPHEAHLAFERQAFSLLFSTEDKKEGVAAFQEKRKPEWKGK